MARLVMVYDESKQSKFLQGQVQWADNLLSKDNIKFPSGRMSHECANEVRDDALDRLIDHIVITTRS